MSNAKEIGTKLADLCRQGKGMDAVKELYADDIVSVEAIAMGDNPREVSGKEAVIGKSEYWEANHEVHSSEVSGPFPHGEDKFAVRFKVDITNKPSGQRMMLEEIGVYEVKGGKVVREEFFYDM